ncbi:recombinase family protein [Caballeronia telluris]|uniref:Resolvase domain-containing protein n=1 Tax=Caballeronia telluris TaxID=326475 RepID=A0A158KGM0_9BURK|nr:recombinase family protein [Caballeronia telluris]SAL80175.1 resolvase domain-containing protein [Caballeronia telluris]
MSKTFLYARVSTSDQTTANQLLQAEKAGYVIAQRHVYEETISGTVAAMDRPQFARLVGKLDEGDKLVVTKLDRLGRNARDIDATVAMLRDMKVSVIVLDLPVMEVTSAAGDLVMRMFAAFAQFERDQLVERTHAGLARARDEGKIAGRPAKLTATQITDIKAKLDAGATARGLAKEYGVSHPTISKAVKAEA